MRLPAYLFPSAVVQLSQLPRTTTGILDESSFPPPAAADYKFTGDDYVAPRNEIEVRLGRLWCETLKRDQISVRDNFFEIGGQSLLAVALFLRIEDEFSRRLPLVTLFSCPTIESLAILLSSEKEKSAWDSLVPIQPQGSKPPLFLVHGAGGNVLLYRNLAKHFARDYPLYGLQSRGLDSVSRPLTTIEEMADAYLAEVRAVQKTGPYHLGGYCLGGTIAYEMARILRSQ